MVRNRMVLHHDADLLHHYTFHDDVDPFNEKDQINEKNHYSNDKKKEKVIIHGSTNRQLSIPIRGTYLFDDDVNHDHPHHDQHYNISIDNPVDEVAIIVNYDEDQVI